MPFADENAEKRGGSTPQAFMAIRIRDIMEYLAMFPLGSILVRRPVFGAAVGRP